jgi:hypothetical protein
MSTADHEHGRQCYDEHLMLVCNDAARHVDPHEFCNHAGTADLRAAVEALALDADYDEHVRFGFDIAIERVLALIAQHSLAVSHEAHPAMDAQANSGGEGVRVTPETLAGWMREHWYHSMARRCACGAVVSPASHPEHITAAIIARLEPGGPKAHT